MVTLKTVAREAGVHVATASAVLNGAGGNTRVSVTTRRRVMAAAKKLSYLPNESAQRLRSGKSNVVAFLGGDLRNPFFAELAATLETDLASRGLQLFVANVGHSESVSIETTVNSLRQQGVQRIIRWAESPSTRSLAALPHTVDLPIGFTTHDQPGIWLDLEFAIEKIVAHLAGKGFRKFGFYSPGGRKESPSVPIRTKVFSSQCLSRGLPPPVLACFEGESWNLDAASVGAEKVIQEHREIEAWVAFNDIAGLGLLSRLNRNLTARVICFDGTAMVRRWPDNPPHLDLKIRELSRKAAISMANDSVTNAVGTRENWIKPILIN
ncbi:hypothetical protein BH09VER1_BH09VER1_17420 [soil metagenome]